MLKETKVVQKTFLAGIAGPSGAGKTELARRISRLLNAPIYPLDSYYRDLAHMPLETERDKILITRQPLITSCYSNT